MRPFAILIAVMLTSSSLWLLLASGESEGFETEEEGWINGNQELVADPARPLVYFGDVYGDQVHVFNASTRAEAWSVTVGYSPISIDVCNDGIHLYVAVSTEMTIAIIDLESRSVSKTVQLDFEPLSVRAGLSGRIYVTRAPEETMHSGSLNVVDEDTGDVLETLGGYGRCVLEMSPDRTVLVMVQLSTIPTPIYRFSCDTNRLDLLETDSNDLPSGASQVAMDWENGTIYLAGCSYPYDLEIASLETLDKQGSVTLTQSLILGMALSPDMRTVYCTVLLQGASLYAVDVSTSSIYAILVGFDETDYPVYDAAVGLAAPPHVGAVLALGSPVQFIDLGEPRLSPIYPYPSSTVSGDWVTTFVAGVYLGIPAVEVLSCGVSLDGVTLDPWLLSFAGTANAYLYGNLTEPLAEGGAHTVEAHVAWNGGEASTSWMFYFSSVLMLMSVSPAEDEVVHQIPESIIVDVELGYPEWTMTDCMFTINNEVPELDFDAGTLVADTSDANGSLLKPGLNWVVMRLDFERVSSTEVIYLMWHFDIIDAWAEPSADGLAWHSISTDLALKLPSTWTVTDDYVSGNTVYDVRATGPVDGGVQPTITVQSAMDPDVMEDAYYVRSYADDYFERLQSEGEDIYLVEGPMEREVNGLETMVFAFRWMDEPCVQKVAVMADQETGEYWLLEMKVHDSEFFDMNPMLEGVIASFGGDPDDDPEEGDEQLDPGTFLLMVAGAAAAAIAAVVAVFWLWNRPKKQP